MNFQGETGPYIQYTYVRTKSILEKIKQIPDIKEIKFDKLEEESAQNIIKLIYNFQDVLEQVTFKEEPSILSRYLIELSKLFSTFYNDNKILVDDGDTQNARIYLTYAVGKVLKIGTYLLGIEMPNKM
ncbi:MAG: DALR anticodon-binding domain-containing protein [Clostridia bacterium]